MLDQAAKAAHDQGGATARLADFLASIRFADLPADTIDAAKILVLDLIGCSLGAQRTDEVQAQSPSSLPETDGAGSRGHGPQPTSGTGLTGTVLNQLNRFSPVRYP